MAVNPFPSSQRRHVTPTAEATSPTKVAITTTSSNSSGPQIWSVDRASVSHLLRQPQSAKKDQTGSSTTLPLGGTANMHPPTLSTPGQYLQPSAALKGRHLFFKEFDLREDPSALHKSENRKIVHQTISGIVSISVDGWFVVLQLRELPAKPWPLTFAGLPLYIVTEMSPSPMPPMTAVSRNNGSIAQDVDGQNMQDWKPLFHCIRDHFERIQVSITEVMYMGNAVCIVLKHRTVDRAKLPWQAGNIVCSYLYDDEMGRPSAPQAHRAHHPTPDNADNTLYKILQPGVRVVSSYRGPDSGQFFETTAGVLLRDASGNEYMTVASHGSPDECGHQVMHPQPDTGRVIGEVIQELSHTDIALVKLKDKETFLNQTFATDDAETENFGELIPVQNCQRFTTVHLDSPNTGHIEGSFMMTSFAKLDGDSNEPDQVWIFTSWLWMGQEPATDLPDGVCGSAIWTEDKDVLGFFRFCPRQGAMQTWCSGIAADELINRQFVLVDTSNRPNVQQSASD